MALRMQLSKLILMAFLSSTVLSNTCSANVMLAVTEVPYIPAGPFSAKISGASTIDPTPNPCYGKPRCKLIMFTINESWLPDGKAGYVSADLGWQTPGPQSSYKTVGEWWAAVTDKERVGQDYLPLQPGEEYSPCIAVAASDQYGAAMTAGTIISNCARGIVQATSCTITPNTISVQLQATLGSDVGEQSVGGVKLSCTSPANIIIETNSGEIIPLGGNSLTSAVLDWGNGFGKPGRISVSEPGDVPLPLRVMTQGLAAYGVAGSLSGSSIVNVSYQ